MALAPANERFNRVCGNSQPARQDDSYIGDPPYEALVGSYSGQTVILRPAAARGTYTIERNHPDSPCHEIGVAPGSGGEGIDIEIRQDDDMIFLTRSQAKVLRIILQEHLGC